MFPWNLESKSQKSQKSQNSGGIISILHIFHTHYQNKLKTIFPAPGTQKKLVSCVRVSVSNKPLGTFHGVELLSQLLIVKADNIFGIKKY